MPAYCGYYISEPLINEDTVGTRESCDYGRDYCPSGSWCPIQQLMLQMNIKKGIEDGDKTER